MGAEKRGLVTQKVNINWFFKNLSLYNINLKLESKKLKLILLN